MKNRAIKLSGAAIVAGSAFMAFSFPFFEMMVRSKKGTDPVTKKWFQLSHSKVNHPRHKFEKEYETGKAWCREQPMQDCYIKSIDGLRLHASFLPAKNAKRFVILCHGYKGSGFGDFANIARFLHENGCHLLFIDERCCGQSEGSYITFGAKEQYDIQRWCYYVARRNPGHLPIYLFGESMGAASLLMASGHALPGDVKGLIADCGFQSMKGQLQDIAANWFHLHWIHLLLFRVNLFCAVLGGFRMKDADTSRAMQINRRPVLFFHGADDTYVDPKNSIRNYSMCRAPKELVIVSGARHLCSAYEDPELYRRKLLEFFKMYDSE